MHRELGGASFAELGLPEGLGRDAELEALHDSIDWGPFERLLRDVYNSREGRKAYPPIVMLKINILQQWYGGASDPAIERALGRDLAFRRFVGLGLNDGQPDHSTIHRFRAQLERDGLAERLFAELRRQQEASGLLAREGALLDATRIEAQASTRRLDSEQGPTDPDARFGRDVYGYQMHISSDFATGLICNAALTPGNVNETEVADALLLGGERFVPADRAYDTRERRVLYDDREIEYLILRRGNRHHPLSEAERERNRALAKLRRRVEAVFGTFKRSYGYRTVRYFNLARNTVEMWCKLFAYNLRRGLRLAQSAA